MASRQVKRLREAGNQPVATILRVDVTNRMNLRINLAHMKNQSFSNWDEERACAPSARFGGPKKGKWGTMALPNIDRTLRTGKCLSESRVKNGSMAPEREERGAPRGGYPSFICQDEITLRSSRVMRNLAAGRWGEGLPLRAPPWRGSSVGTGLELNKRVLWIPSTLSAHQHAMDTEARRPHQRSPRSGSSRRLRFHPDKQLTTRRQQKKKLRNQKRPTTSRAPCCRSTSTTLNSMAAINFSEFFQQHSTNPLSLPPPPPLHSPPQNQIWSMALQGTSGRLLTQPVPVRLELRSVD